MPYGEVGRVVAVTPRRFAVAFVVGMGHEEVVWVDREQLGERWQVLD